MKRVFSHTQLDMLQRCGQQWVFRYVERIRRPPATAMIVGRAVDKGVTRDLTAKKDTGHLLPTEVVVAAARDAFDVEWSKEGVMLTDDEAVAGVKAAHGQAVDRTVNSARAHHRRLAPRMVPVELQRRFDVDLDGYDARLVGYLDIEEADGAIRDTKATGKTPHDDDAAQSQQLTMYAMAKLALDGIVPPELSLDYVVALKQRTDVVRLTTRRSIADFNPLLRRIEQALHVIETGTITPAPAGSWWCSPRWCGYWDICPFVRSSRVAVTRMTLTKEDEEDHDEEDDLQP